MFYGNGMKFGTYLTLALAPLRSAPLRGPRQLQGERGQTGLQDLLAPLLWPQMCCDIHKEKPLLNLLSISLRKNDIQSITHII